MIKQPSPLEALERIKYNLSEDVTSDLDDNLDIIETALEDFEWLKHKLNLTFLNSLSSPEDKMRVMKIMGVEYGKEN